MTDPEPVDWRKKLQGHPPATALACERYLASNNSADLDFLIIEILRYFHPEPASLRASAFAPDKHLNQDLGLDSVALVEAVFLLEDLFEISIPNEELDPIQTFGDLQNYLRIKLADSGTLPGHP